MKIHAIFNRAKAIDSFKEKIKDPKYDNPQEQITDLAGIRIICYVESDVPLICKVIEDNFDIDKENSSDKSRLLGTDKVGYKSVHYVAKLNSDRLKLPEYKNYIKSKLEIQIRTILQHAWAEIEHDRNYKFSGELPDEIQRRFKLVAGSLELADKEFDRIASEIDKINVQIEKGTKEGKLNFEINTTTLKQFLTTKFNTLIPALVEPHFATSKHEIKILKEIESFGLRTLNDLNAILPTDFQNAIKIIEDPPVNFLGLLRLAMIVSDWKKYFENSYDNSWSIDSLIGNDIIKYYKIPTEQILRKFGKKSK